jgi:UDP-perosamine 4-acetyltransferase
VSSGIVVVGAGGHAKVCIELLRAMGEDVAFCIGANDARGDCLGVPILAGDDRVSDLRTDGFDRAFVAVGDNRVRRKLGAAVVTAGYRLVNAVSPTAVVSPSARLGVGIAIMGGAVINAESTIGDLVIINTGATVDHDCSIGEAAHIAPQSALAGNVRVGACSFLGIGTTVVPGCDIGEEVVVGAGGVVISDVPDGVTAVGVPVRVLEREREELS